MRALGGPAGVHLQEDVRGKRVVVVQRHVEKQRVLALQLHGAAVLMGVGLVRVQRHGQPQLLGQGKLLQGQGGEPTIRVWRGVGVYLPPSLMAQKTGGKSLTTPCPRWLRCCECNGEGRRTSR